MKSLPKKATERGSAYDRCLVALADRDTNAAVAALGGINQPALRAVARDQISIVEELERRLHQGERDGVESLITSLIGGVCATYGRLLRRASPLARSDPTDISAQPEAGRSSPQHTRKMGERPAGQRVNAPPSGESISPQDLTNAEAEMRTKIAPMTLDQQFGLRDDAIRLLCAIAAKSWMRRSNRSGIDRLRTSRTEIGVTAICLREHLAGNAAPIPVIAIASFLAVTESHVVNVAAALCHYLLRGSGWTLVRPTKEGVLLVPDSASD